MAVLNNGNAIKKKRKMRLPFVTTIHFFAAYIYSKFYCYIFNAKYANTYWIFLIVIQWTVHWIMVGNDKKGCIWVYRHGSEGPSRNFNIFIFGIIRKIKHLRLRTLVRNRIGRNLLFSGHFLVQNSFRESRGLVLCAWSGGGGGGGCFSILN